MNKAFIDLLNELMSDPEKYEPQSHTVLKDESLKRGNAWLSCINNEYLIQTYDCSSCSDSHVNCKLVETIVTNPIEALETLEGMAS
jgi:hypothetical protein